MIADVKTRAELWEYNEQTDELKPVACGTCGEPYTDGAPWWNTVRDGFLWPVCSDECLRLLGKKQTKS